MGARLAARRTSSGQQRERQLDDVRHLQLPSSLHADDRPWPRTDANEDRRLRAPARSLVSGPTTLALPSTAAAARPARQPRHRQLAQARLASLSASPRSPVRPPPTVPRLAAASPSTTRCRSRSSPPPAGRTRRGPLAGDEFTLACLNGAAPSVLLAHPPCLSLTRADPQPDTSRGWQAGSRCPNSDESACGPCSSSS